MFGAIIDAMYGGRRMPIALCSTSNCTWPTNSYMSLGIISHCEDVTNKMNFVDCPSNAQAGHCTLQTPGGGGLP
jgi:hypothetical protein